ncbi:condensin complex subunit 3-like isoform X2 [Clavelina lepadiformis]|uniref:condensin complex subunit 3-like isoform X2 n=1 Tax=Clavelina lepadiformis TaxID=159417 RepID=UPI0040414B1F
MMDYNIKAKIRSSFDKCQERRCNLTKLSETLKKFYDEKCSEALSRDEFFSQFLYHVQCLLQEPARDFATERCMQFVAKFASLFANTFDEEEETEEVVDDDLFNFLLKFVSQPEYHCHSNKTIRFRICQLVQLFLHSVPRDAALDEDLMDCITKVMLDRIDDKNPVVRCQAAKSLSRLQQPALQDCPVIEAYLFHMACDESSQVRAAVVSNISLTTKTLPCVLDRTRDISEAVRKIAFQIIAQKVSIKALTSSQRLYLIKQGLQDRSDVVQKVVKTQLFQAWLLTFDANLINLLKKLDVVGAYETCCRAVKAMYEWSNIKDLIEGFNLLNDNKTVDFNQLTPEAALYWSQLFKYVRSKGAGVEHYLDVLLPSTLSFSQYLEEFLNKFLLPFMDLMESKNIVDISPEEEDDRIEKEFVAQQLIKIASKMDISDNTGRNGLHEFFEKALIKIDVLCFPCLVSPLTSGLLELLSASSASVGACEEGKVCLVAKLISTIRDPHVPNTPPALCMSEDEIRNLKQEIAKISVKLLEAKEDMEISIDAKDFVKASEIQKLIEIEFAKKSEMEDKLKINSRAIQIEDTSSLPEKSDVGTLIKCLQIIKDLLASLFESRCAASGLKKSVPKSIHPTLLQLLDTLVIPSVLNTTSDVRKEAIRGLGVACMFSSVLAARHFPLLIQVAQADTYLVRVAAINATNDLIRLFGLRLLFACKKNKSSKDEGVEEEHTAHDSDNEYDDEDVGAAIMTKFLDMLDDENVEVRQAVICLLAKVLVSHHILSPAVVSRLILTWYNPATQDEPQILHMISNFLNIFPYMSKQAHECMEAAFLPILRILFNAPCSSPYASVNADNVAELLVSITRPSIIQSADLKGICEERDTKWLNDGSAHDNIAMMVSNEILSDARSPYVNTLCKILPTLDINPDLTENVKDLKVLCENMLKEVKDKHAIRHIRKFETQLTGFKKQAKNIPAIKVNDLPAENVPEPTTNKTALNEPLPERTGKGKKASKSTIISTKSRKKRVNSKSTLPSTPVKNLNKDLVEAEL